MCSCRNGTRLIWCLDGVSSGSGWAVTRALGHNLRADMGSDHRVSVDGFGRRHLGLDDIPVLHDAAVLEPEYVDDDYRFRGPTEYSTVCHHQVALSRDASRGPREPCKLWGDSAESLEPIGHGGIVLDVGLAQ